MKITIENRDLFMVPQGYYLAHCISGDFALGAGIALQFCEIYNMKEKLQEIALYEKITYKDYVGTAILVDNVFNLVTKEKCYHKPTYANLKYALLDMKEYLLGLKITKLAMPKIGCGLDGLSWTEVKEILEEVFSDMDLEILVCYL